MYFVYTPSYLLRKLFERRKKSQGIECCSKRLGCNLLGHSSSGLPLKWPHAAGCDWKLDFTGSFFFQPGLERCNLQRSWFQGPVLLYGEATSRVNGGIKKRAVLSFFIATHKKKKKKHCLHYRHCESCCVPGHRSFSRCTLHCLLASSASLSHELLMQNMQKVVF